MSAVSFDFFFLNVVIRKPEITCLVHLVFLLDVAGVRVFSVSAFMANW